MHSPGTLLLDRFKIVRYITRGGQGEVYEAWDTRLDIAVAVKHTCVDEDWAQELLLKEGRLLASLHHQALPQVIDSFIDQDSAFLVMKFIPGDDLYQLVKKNKGLLPANLVLGWAYQLLDALDYLHRQDPPIIHRDVKPKNIKLTEDGHIFLLDFGIAKLMVSGRTPFYGPGTLSYAPLEQLQDSGTDVRSDLHSMAATLYYLLTGVEPIGAVARAKEIRAGGADPLCPANEINPEVSPRIAQVLMRAMSLNREERPHSAVVMQRELRNAASLSGLVRRYLIDGSNVCHYFQAVPSVASLLTLLIELRKRGETFLCIFDANIWHVLNNSGASNDARIYREFSTNLPDFFSEVPGRTQADDYLLKLADSSGDSIISNDQYRKYISNYTWIASAPERLIKGKVAGRTLVIPPLNLDIPITKTSEDLWQELKSIIKGDSLPITPVEQAKPIAVSNKVKSETHAEEKVSSIRADEQLTTPAAKSILQKQPEPALPKGKRTIEIPVWSSESLNPPPVERKTEVASTSIVELPPKELQQHSAEPPQHNPQPLHPPPFQATFYQDPAFLQYRNKQDLELHRQAGSQRDVYAPNPFAKWLSNSWIALLKTLEDMSDNFVMAMILGLIPFMLLFFCIMYVGAYIGIYISELLSLESPFTKDPNLAGGIMVASTFIFTGLFQRFGKHFDHTPLNSIFIYIGLFVGIYITKQSGLAITKEGGPKYFLAPALGPIIGTYIIVLVNLVNDRYRKRAGLREIQQHSTELPPLRVQPDTSVNLATSPKPILPLKRDAGAGYPAILPRQAPIQDFGPFIMRSIGVILIALVLLVSLWRPWESSKPTSGKTSTDKQENNQKPSDNLQALPLKMRSSLGIEFILIPTGSFQMGSEKGETDERPVHQVIIKKPFYLGKYEVTQSQWEAVMGNNPSHFKGANRPVEAISWDDAQEFIRHLNMGNDGYTYRLPTEAEWEYACRAGTAGDYAGNLNAMGWYNRNSGDLTHAIGTKKPNAWGLYDMHGNVNEWCQDWYQWNYNGAPTDGSAWESGKKEYRVARGGSWGDGSLVCRSTERAWSSPSQRLGRVIGLRLAADARTR